MQKARSARRSPLRDVGGSLFLILFGGVFVYFLYPPLLEYLDSANWTARQCTILSAELVEDGRPATTSQQSRVLYGDRYRYSYIVDGTSYQSSRYTFLNPLTSDVETHQRRLAKYSPGTVLTCYVDPKKPSAAVISRDFSLFNLLILLPSAFILLGTLGLLSTLRSAGSNSISLF